MQTNPQIENTTTTTHNGAIQKKGKQAADVAYSTCWKRLVWHCVALEKVPVL